MRLKNFHVLLTIIAAVLLGACNDGTGPAQPVDDCPLWDSCHPGEVVMRTTILTNVFPPTATRNGKPVWAPGDSIALRVSVENQTASTIDSLQVAYHYTEQLGVSGHWKQADSLPPNKRYEFVDTIVVNPIVFDSVLPLRLYLTNPPWTRLIEHRLFGDSLISALRASLNIEVIGMPDTQTVTRPNRAPRVYATVRAHTPATFRLRLSNPYDLPINVQLTSCLYDLDFCAETWPNLSYGSLAAGATRDIDLPVTILNQERVWYTFWWGYTSISVCMTGSHSRCIGIPIVLMPNIEADCKVENIVPGVDVRPIADCGNAKDAKAYRFTARAGGRFRIEATPAFSAVITDSSGIHYHNGTNYNNPPYPQDFFVPRDGTYYVIATRYTSSFRLIDLNP